MPDIYSYNIRESIEKIKDQLEGYINKFQLLEDENKDLLMQLNFLKKENDDLKNKLLNYI